MTTRLTVLCGILLLLVNCASVVPAMAKPPAAGESRPALSPAQKQALQAIDDEAKKKAAPIALHFAEIVQHIYENMLADKPDEELREKLDQGMKETTWELLSIKGQAIRDSLAVLTPEQRQLLRAEVAKPGAPADLMEVIGRVYGGSGK